MALCPVSLRQSVVWETHRQQHSGIRRTIERLRTAWYWPGMTADTRRQVQTCEVCQASKHSATTRSTNRQRLQAGRPWQKIAIDLVGPLTRTPRGNNTILVLSDHFTRWKDAIAMPDGTAPTVARELETIFCYMGIPEQIHSDQGSQFESRLMAELCTVWGTKKTRTTPYNPGGNGKVERGNRTLGDSLRSLLQNRAEDDWDLLLPQIMRGFRATPHSASQETPNYLMFGRELRLPEHLTHGMLETESESRQDYAIQLTRRLTEAHDLLRKEEKEIRLADTREAPIFQQGDRVWLLSKRRRKGTTKKLQARYVGPYKIEAAMDNHTYRIRCGDKESTESERRLKLYHPSTTGYGRIPTQGEPTRRKPCMGRPAVRRKKRNTKTEDRPVRSRKPHTDEEEDESTMRNPQRLIPDDSGESRSEVTVTPLCPEVKNEIGPMMPSDLQESDRNDSGVQPPEPMESSSHLLRPIEDKSRYGRVRRTPKRFEDYQIEVTPSE